MYSFTARRSEASPNKISFDRHSRRMEPIQRSAKAFRFGLLGGRPMSGFRLTEAYRETQCRILNLDHEEDSACRRGIRNSRQWRCELSASSTRRWDVWSDRRDSPDEIPDE